MSNKMLIDAIHPEETRVVVVRDKRVEDFDFEAASRKPLRGNIYLAKVTKVEPSLQAAFVEYGGNRNGFLAFSEIHPDYYQIPQADRAALLADERTSDDEEDEPREKRRSRRGGRRKSGEKTKDAPAAAEASGDNAPANEALADDAGGPTDGEGETVIETDAEDALRDEAADPTGPWATALEGAAPRDDAEAQSIQVASPSDPMVSADVADPSADAVPQPSAAERPEDETVSQMGPSEEGSAGDDKDQVAIADETRAAAHEAASAPDTTEQATSAPEAEGGDDAATEEPASKPKRTRRRTTTKKSDDGLADPSVTDEGEAGDDNGEAEDNGSVTSMGNQDVMEEIPERRRKPPRRHYKIQDVIKKRQILLVQVVKEERGTKGAALTTYLSLAGRYSVLMPNTDRGGGVSRKITDNSDRKRLKDLVAELEVPEGMGIILRTAGAARTKTEIKRDFEYLLRLWENVRELTLKSIAPALVYEEGNLVKRAIRDLYNKEIDEVLVSGDAAYREAKDFMKMLMPSHAKNVKAYREATPIFTAYSVEPQLDAMFSPQVTLPSKGYIVINPTEALVAIDVNSGRSTKEAGIEETALKTNLEAADEVARQLRLRDLAGLIVIDFIDMDDKRHNRQVEKRLKDALKLDRSRIQVGRISPFGLMEMSRQRIRQGMVETSMIACPSCAGTGLVRSTPSVALHCLRTLEEHLLKDADRHLTIKTSSAVALYILNQKRSHLRALEDRFGLEIGVDADETLSGQHMQIIPGPPVDRAPGETVPTTQIAPDAISAEPLDEDKDEDEDETRAEAGGDGGSRSRRRRKRRRRGGDGDAVGREGEPAVAVDAGDEEVADASDEEAAEVSADEEDDGDAGEPRRRRRGRRGGRRHRREDGVVAETKPDDAGNGAQPSNEEPETIVSVPIVDGSSAHETAAEDRANGADSARDQNASDGAPMDASQAEEPAAHALEGEDALADQPEPATLLEPASIAQEGEADDGASSEAAPETKAMPQPERKPEESPRPRRIGWWQRRFLS